MFPLILQKKERKKKKKKIGFFFCLLGHFLLSYTECNFKITVYKNST